MFNGTLTASLRPISPMRRHL